MNHRGKGVMLFIFGSTLAVFLLVAPLSTRATTSNVSSYQVYTADSYYTAFGSTVNILLPKNWVPHEIIVDRVSSSSVPELVLVPQSEESSATTKGFVVTKSDRSVVFNLPTTVANKLSQADLVNFYLDRVLKYSIGGAVVKANVVNLNGNQAYAIERTEVAAGIPSVEFDYFIFKGSDVYHLYGLYPSYDQLQRQIMLNIIQSFKTLR